jgi:flagellar hook-associated protein 2
VDFSSTTRISGLVSGMDTDTLVKKLMTAESAGYNRMMQQQQKLTWQSDAYRQWNTDLFSFRSNTLFNMKLSKSYNTFNVSSTNSDAVSATGTANAIEGTHKIGVSQLASSATLAGSPIIDANTPVGAATLKITTSDGRTASISITASDKIADVVGKLNAARGSDGMSLGVQAMYDTSLNQFILKTKNTGSGTNLTIDDGSNGVPNSLLLNLGLKPLGTNQTWQSAVTTDPVTQKPTSSIDPTAQIGTSTLKIVTSDGTNTSSYDIPVSASDTISQVVTKINQYSAQNNLSLRASYNATNKQFVLTTDDPNVQITGLQDAADNDKSAFFGNAQAMAAGTYFAAGKDSRLTFDGNTANPVVSSSNNVSLLGVNYTLKSTTTSDVTLTTTRDIDTTVKNIKDFISKYNDMIDKIYKTMSEPVYRDYQPLTDDQRTAMTADQIKAWEDKAKSGLLHNDDILSTLYNRIRSDFFSNVDNGSVYNNLASIGIQSGSYEDHGKVTVDEDKLRAALQADPDAVKNLFSQSGSELKSTAQIDSSAQLNLGPSSLKITVGANTYTIDTQATDTITDVVDKINAYASANNVSMQASYDSTTKLFKLNSPSGYDLSIASGSTALGNPTDDSTVKKGLVNRLYDDFYTAFQSTTKKAGVFGNAQDDQSTIGKMLHDLNKQISDEKNHLKDIEDSYYKKFTAMETALSQYQSQSGFLAQQFGMGGK